MTEQCYRQQVARALALYEKAGIVLTDAEKQNVEVADFGLNQVETIADMKELLEKQRNFVTKAKSES